MRLAEKLQEVAAIAGRVQSAAKLSEIMQRNQLPQVCPAAFVLPLGIRALSPADASGLFVQGIDRMEGVLLVVRAADDAKGAAGLFQLEPLIEDVIQTVVGWSPDEDALGVYRLLRGELASLAAGTLTYQLDFAIEDQLRIAR